MTNMVPTAIASRWRSLLSMLGGLTVVACAGDGPVSGSGNSGPITIDQTSVKPSPDVDVGTTLVVGFSASASTGIARSVVRWSGAATGVDSVQHGGQTHVSRLANIHVPRNAPLGENITVTLRVVDVFEQASITNFPPVRTGDAEPPSVAGHVAAPAYVVPADTVNVQMDAWDQGLVRWVGYRVGQPTVAQDSIPVDDSLLVQKTFTFSPRAGWDGPLQTTAFARDEGDNLTQVVVSVLQVVDGVHAKLDTIPLSGDVSDLAYDEARNRVYLAQPGLSQVGVLDLASATAGPPITGLEGVRGLDLTPDGNSLIVTLPGTPFLGVVSLGAVPPTVDTVRLGTIDQGPDRLRVLSDRQVVVTVREFGENFQTSFWQYDLLSHVAARRLDVGYAGELFDGAMMARSADRSHLLVLMAPCCPLHAFVYTTARDSFSTNAIGTVLRESPAVSADSSGERYLIGNEFYTGSLYKLATFAVPQADPFAATVIDAGGAYAYLGTAYGYAIVRTDGTVTGKVVLPFEPLSLWLVGANKLIAVGRSEVGIVDLDAGVPDS